MRVFPAAAGSRPPPPATACSAGDLLAAGLAADGDPAVVQSMPFVLLAHLQAGAAVAVGAADAVTGR
ncbi:hypothetical protein [Streptomyces sp. NPDC056491]|uniref:hypothetical protein n=1 Tax=Streptomyces sp. NPDC056491 TaxID=3345837 RepID=UPI0036A1324B